MSAELIVALDVDTFEKAKKLVDALYPNVKLFKVGSQLFVACGIKVIEYIKKKGADVFLDLKFHDIPNTVGQAVRSAARLGVKMLTLHISGGEDMIKAAVGVAKRPLLIGVTILTSQEASGEDVLSFARAGLDRGLDGIVCSVAEAGLLREKINKKFLVVTPGIRPQGADAGDQKRVATPKAAQEAGSDFIVVGRPIVEADDPLAAAKQILKEMR